MHTVVNAMGRIPFWALVLVLLAAFSLRAVALEADLPSLGVGMSSMLDQGTYSKQAISFFEYGSWNHAGAYEITTQDAQKAIVLGNLLQVVTLSLFGDNYVGFRLPYLLFALLSFMLTLLVLRKTLDIAGASINTVKLFTLALGVVFLLDFPLHVMSLTVENSVTRLLSNLLFLYVALSLRKSVRLKSFILGFIALANVFFVYFSSVTTAGMLVLVLIWLIWRRSADVRKYTLFSILGAICAVLLAEAYYLSAWGQEAFYTAYSGVMSFSERLDPAQSQDAPALFTSLFTYLKNGLAMWTSNPFFYSPFLLGLSIVSLIGNTVYALKEKSMMHFLLAGFVILFFAQALAASDWNIRKTVCVYPIMLVGCALFCYQYKPYWVGRLANAKPAMLITGTALFALLYVMLVLAAYGVRANFMDLAENPGSFLADFGKVELRVAIASSCVQSALFVAVLVVALAKVVGNGNPTAHRSNGKPCAKEPNGKNPVKAHRRLALPALFCAGLCFTVSVNVAFSWKYFYGKPTFTEKEAMVEIGELIGGDYVTSPFAYSYTLYNDIKPLDFSDGRNREYFQEGVAAYTLDYHPDALYVSDRYVDDKRDLVLVDSFYRKQRQWGVQKDIFVYRLRGNGEEAGAS